MAASLGGRAFRGNAAEVRRLAAARRTHFHLAGAVKRAAQAELSRAETALARRLLDDGCATLEAAIAELLNAGRNRDLFGRRRGLDLEQRLRLGRLRQSLRELRAARRRLRLENAAPFFSFESHFADVMAQGGFDLVTGNPPWVRAERLAPRVRETLAARYSCWRPAVAATRGFAHLPDLAVAFTERGRDQGRTFESQEELAYCLTNPGSGGRTHSRPADGSKGCRNRPTHRIRAHFCSARRTGDGRATFGACGQALADRGGNSNRQFR